MTSNKKIKAAIKRLSEANQRYDLGVEAATSGVPNVQGAKAVLQIMERGEDGKLITVRRGSAYGFGKTLEEAQNAALLTTIENLGI